MRRIWPTIICILIVACVIFISQPTRASDGAMVDINGPYGTKENPYCVGDIVTFEATIIGDNIDEYEFRWDINNDGTFETTWDPYPIYNFVFTEPFIGIAKVEAWDGSWNGEVPAILTDTASVYVIRCPIRMLEDLTDFIDSSEPNDFSKPNYQKTLNNKINAILNYLDINDQKSIFQAIHKLKFDILPKFDGENSPSDWVIGSEIQKELEEKINEIIDALFERADEL